MKQPKLTNAAFKVLKAYQRGECHNKRLIEEIFSRAVSSWVERGKCLKLSGFDYNHYIQCMFPKLATEVCIVEKEPYIFHEIYKQAKKCKYNNRKKVELLQGDVAVVNSSNCVYVDLDMMQKLEKMIPAIKHQISLQRETVDGAKAISFTANIRHGGTAEERFYLIQELLHEEFDADLLGFNGNIEGFGETKNAIEVPGAVKGRQGVHIHRYVPDFTDMGDVLVFDHIHYADSSHFMTSLIIYR